MRAEAFRAIEATVEPEHAAEGDERRAAEQAHEAAIATALAEHATDDELSSREIEVLQLIATGNSNKEIADRLSIGEATVKSHVSNILSKLGANDRAHAVTIGLTRGIIAL